MNSELPSFTTQEEVMFFDTDIGGVVHNLAYLRMIETCRTKLATEKLGLNLKHMADSGLFPVVLRTEVDYRSPATLGHKLTIKGRLDSVEKVKFWCAFEIYAEGVEKCLITCRQSLAMVQMGKGDKPSRPQRLPKEWRDRWCQPGK
ncbi:MAG: acyl-CoA thioesterase [Akkermansiaceae bacterium]